MAGHDRGHTAPLGRRLAEEVQRFDIRQAVRLLEQARPGVVALGDGSDPEREALWLRGSLSSRFPASDLESFADGAEGERPSITVAFMTLAGAFGPLPPPLNARIAERERLRDHATRDFLDIFNHRLLSLYLRQWRLLHPALQPPDDPRGPARLPLWALLGLADDPPGAACAPLVPAADATPLAATLLSCTGLLNQRPISAHALERVLTVHFGHQVKVRGHQGGWLPLAPGQQTRLGCDGRLGLGAALGERVWDQEAGFEIAMGPIGIDAFTDLLPGHPGQAALVALLRHMVGDRFDVDLRLMLRADDVPQGGFTAGLRLGQTAWIGQRARTAPGMVLIRLKLGPERFGATIDAPP